MKRFAAVLILLSFLTVSSFSQENNSIKEGYKFIVVKEHPVTSIKNQNRTSTCWSFSALSFLESELIRTGKGTHDLSEMFIVSNAYYDKADKYIRTSGNINFAPGSSFGDVLAVWKNYGIVPDEVMPGLNYGEKNHIHNEFDAALSGYVKALVRNPNGKYTPAWKEGFRGILNAYLGEVPQKFTYKGKEYTPKSFAAELGILSDDYVSLTSYTHHPFYSEFALEIPDNWRWDRSYNLPIDELMMVFDFAIEKGYTVLWASDVSEKKITQEARQIAFDNGQTTDDHGMHIYGIAKDQKGNKYYMVKNSWGETGDYKGIWYVSETFARYKTMNIVVHKNSIPAGIKAKLGIK